LDNHAHAAPPIDAEFSERSRVNRRGIICAGT
jgi:hypothetical protein